VPHVLVCQRGGGGGDAQRQTCEVGFITRRHKHHYTPPHMATMASTVAAVESADNSTKQHRPCRGQWQGIEEGLLGTAGEELQPRTAGQPRTNTFREVSLCKVTTLVLTTLLHTALVPTEKRSNRHEHMRSDCCWGAFVQGAHRHTHLGMAAPLAHPGAR
jgi:hypothetical protein